jgi:endonuclease YncB( thermonuclease family)
MEKEEKAEQRADIKKEEISKTDIKKPKLREIIKKANEETISLDDKKEKIIYWLVALVFILLIVAFILSIPKPYKQILTMNNTVVEIVDGNTFKYYDSGLNKDITVRLLCVDIPRNKSEEAKAYLRGLISFREVTLKSSAKNKDLSGRLLRYTYVNNNGNIWFVNKLMIDNGYGKLKTYSWEDCKEITQK